MSLMKWLIHYILQYPNYTIRSVDVSYEVIRDRENSTPFWDAQKLDRGVVSVRGLEDWCPVPDFILIHSVAIHYWYNGITYTHVAPKTDKVQWPPVRTTMRFSMPLRSLELIGPDGETLVDMTEAAKRFLGPMNDLSLFERVRQIRATNLLGVSFSSEVKFQLP